MKPKKEIMNQKVKTNNIFSTCNGILIYGERVVIPAVLTKKIFTDFYTGHPGRSRMKSLMRSYVYWPRKDKDVENMVKSCKSFASVAKVAPIKFNLNSEFKPPLKKLTLRHILPERRGWVNMIKFNPWPWIDKPLSHLHIDYAGPINGTYIFVRVDSFTKWSEVFKCKTPTTKTYK